MIFKQLTHKVKQVFYLNIKKYSIDRKFNKIFYNSITI